MKKITNWRKGTVADLEANGLDDATVIHILSYHLQQDKVGDIHGGDKEKLLKFFNYHIDNNIPVVGHRFKWYDIPLCERLLGVDLSELMVIDTLILSWYLNTDREVHGLDSFHEDYGIKKPKVQNHRWQAPEKEGWNTEEGYQRRLKRHHKIMSIRCGDDVKINKALWEDFKDRLTGMYAKAKYHIDRGDVDGNRMSSEELCYIDQYKNTSTVDEYVDRILTFLMFKGDTAALREKTKFECDVESLEELIEELDQAWSEAKTELEKVMPEVPKYTKKSRPKKPFKKDGSISATGQRWLDAEALLGKKDEKGNELASKVDKDTIKLLSTYDKPNANGTQQIKDWLYSHGWEPQTFEYIKDKAATQKWAEGGFRKSDKPEIRKVPQLSVKGDNGKELCPSVLALADKVPQVMYYNKYTTVKHRLDMAKGFKDNLTGGKYLKARIGGITNTMRDQHRELVNLPGVHAPYGEKIRGLLIAGEGNILLGSDLSSLEDRVKHHFMMPYDEGYVNTMMADDFDPHILMALTADMITQEEFDDFKAGNPSANAKMARKQGKTANYACLPTDNTEVLTKGGWVKGAEVKVGMEVMGYNQEEDRNEWTKVEHTHFYKDAKVVKFGNHNWSMESTLNHRWYGKKRSRGGGWSSYDSCVFTTEEITTEHLITNTAPFHSGVSSVLPHEAALVAWLISDGHYWWSELGDGPSSSFGKKRGVRASIAQASHKYQKEIKEVLTKNNLTWTTSKLSSLNQNTQESYNIPAKQFREFYDRVLGEREQKHDYDWVSWVLGLNQESLKTFVHNFWLADGDSKGRQKDSYKTFKQNRGNIADALVLAGYLLGYNVTQTGGKCSYIRMQMNRKHTTAQKIKVTEERRSDVFCLTTGLGSFVVRQGKQITITGNCVYGSGAETLSRNAGMPLATAKKLIEAYWKLNWSVKAIAEDQCVFTCEKGKKWLINPVNGFCYSLRKDADRFSTLCQGTGSFFFDMWLDKILSGMHNNFKVKRLSGNWHDEYVTCFKDTESNRKRMEDLTHRSIEEVTVEYKLRRDLGCDVQFGDSYAQIH